MCVKPLVIVKFGGSAVTFKNEVKRANLQVIRRLAREVYESMFHVNLVIVHGGGSFGHPFAHKYNLVNGFSDVKQLAGLAETRYAMNELNQIIVRALIDAGVPAITIQPSSCVVLRNGSIVHFYLEPIRLILKLNCVPVLYGDVVFDEFLGFTILSGDKISSYLALKLNAERLVFACDVDGVYTADPKVNCNAKFISEIEAEELASFLKSISADSGVAFDVTGGIIGKLNELIEPALRGVEVLIVNALKPGFVRRAILGEEVKCTRIVKHFRK
ncbi:MAG: isopentenyl phosphate kinase [archaeon GB-1867-035]|nr:isopentenyl phosphate kinase [Candidatus Culexmicrobium profundum]